MRPVNLSQGSALSGAPWVKLVTERLRDRSNPLLRVGNDPLDP
jgi:hypothetical protein